MPTGWLAVAAVVVALFGGACSRAGAAVGTNAPTNRPGLDAGQAEPEPVKNPDAGTAEGAALPVVEEGDCPAICDKLLRCKQGPWQKAADCVDACEPSNEDATSGRTYRCVAKAKSCARMKKCTR